MAHPVPVEDQAEDVPSCYVFSLYDTHYTID